MKLIKRIVISAAFCFFIFFLFRCDSTEPPIEVHGLVLELKDVSCTEAWIEVSTINLQIPATVILKQNNQTRTTINLVNPDSLLYIDSLLPNQSYTFQSLAQQINQTEVKSNEISATTMDTTSHSFSWQTWTFGEHSSSVLYDVAIIDENNIWAVGEIYMNDSLGQPDPIFYNAIHWDGNQWDLRRITANFRGNLIAPPLEDVNAFSNTDIWFVGSLPIHGDGQNWVMYDLRTTLDPTISLSKACGISSDKVYFVGRNGSMVLKSENVWQKLASVTTLNLLNIAGNQNENLITCGGDYSSGRGVILKIVGMNVSKIIESYYFGNGFDSTKLFNTQLYGPQSGVWIDEYGNLITAGNFIFRYRNNKWDYAPGIFANYIGVGQNTFRGYVHSIDGNKMNDFCFVGEYGTVQHYNGYTAIQIGEQFNFQSEYDYYGVDVNENLILVVGKKSFEASIRMFRR